VKLYQLQIPTFLTPNYPTLSKSAPNPTLMPTPFPQSAA